MIQFRKYGKCGVWSGARVDGGSTRALRDGTERGLSCQRRIAESALLFRETGHARVRSGSALFATMSSRARGRLRKSPRFRFRDQLTSREICATTRSRRYRAIHGRSDVHFRFATSENSRNSLGTAEYNEISRRAGDFD